MSITNKIKRRNPKAHSILALGNIAEKPLGNVINLPEQQLLIMQDIFDIARVIETIKEHWLVNFQVSTFNILLNKITNIGNKKTTPKKEFSSKVPVSIKCQILALIKAENQDNIIRIVNFGQGIL
jgi:hypothetical protein